LFNIARVLNLKGREIDFFESLVHFNDATTTQEREYYLDRMQKAEPKHEGVRLQRNQYEYFSKWYHSVVRELVTQLKFDGDYKILAKVVDPAITPKQARESVELLLKLELIRKNEKTGRYEYSDPYITTRDTVVAVAVNKYQRETMDLALNAHQVEERELRDFSTLTIGVSRKGYERIRNELKNFRAHISRIVAEDNPADRVYQINYQLFPLSKIRKPAKG
ncbi:MAG: TIGR02147 family protein, partial [Chitinispirillaceae bacterium]|nr:TIGR02147 family protein [Chitinispirillaceae bacterium]